MIKLVDQQVSTLHFNCAKQKKSESTTKLTKMVIGLSFLWKKLYLWRYFRKGISSSSLDPLPEVVFFSCGTKPNHVEIAYETLSLMRVFSPHLNPEKHWYALNSTLCCSKPAAFCSTSSANLFPEEYKLVFLNDLRGEDGAQVSFRWFCSFRSSEKVYVASAFGLLLGILRLKSWSNCQFMKSDYIHCLISVLNARGLQCKVGDSDQNIASLPTQVTAVEALYFTPQVKSSKGCQKVDLPTPPSTPRQSPPNPESPPKFESPPRQIPSDVHPKRKKRTIEEIKVDQDLSPPSKRKKVREVATRIIQDIREVCVYNGETLGTVLAECSKMTGKEGQDVRETVKSVVDVMVAEKGARKAFEKLVSEDAWNERVKCMRVPDWMYLLFKLKSRISDSGWQDLTNLTKLARTGCKEWGFLLLEMFGTSLGTGDYGHLTVEHVPMLFRRHRSLGQLSNQGFEAAHKLQRQLYTRATSHDASGNASSLDQILSHLYTEMLLNMRLAFREAKQCMTTGELFYYRGCGWKAKRMHWNKEDRQWIHRMDELFTNLFGPDYCEYEYTEKTKHCVVVAGQFPLIQYQHEEWEQTFKNDIPSPVPQQHGRTATKVKRATEHQTRSDIAGTAPQHVNNNAHAAIGSPKAAATPQQHGSSSTATMASVTSAATTAPAVINSTEATPVERSTKQFHRIRATKPPDSAPSNQNLLLRLDRVNLLTRGEIAALVLPRVASISNDDIMLAPDQTEVKDPLSVSLRPSESAVDHALKLFREDSKRKNVGPIDVDSDDDCDDKAIVTLGRLGTFSKESVGVFQTMCTVASMAARVREEQRWFSNDNRSPPGHLDEVRDVLLNSRPKEEIIRQGTCIMDATDFSTLACERYVNGFAIDTICSKFLEDSRPVEIVFLPSFSQAWAMQGASYFSQMVRPFFGHCAVNSAKYILSPLHFDTPQHWGVLCFDTANQTVYFDDGLKLSPPRDTIVIVKNMLSGFKWLSNNDIFHEQEWNQPKLALPLPRINMPRQTSTGQGAGSCGIGVILSVRDVIKNQTCPAPFQWVFEEMSSLRKELMALVLQWKK